MFVSVVNGALLFTGLMKQLRPFRCRYNSQRKRRCPSHALNARAHSQFPLLEAAKAAVDTHRTRPLARCLRELDVAFSIPFCLCMCNQFCLLIGALHCCPFAPCPHRVPRRCVHSLPAFYSRFCLFLCNWSIIFYCIIHAPCSRARQICVCCLLSVHRCT